MNGSTEELIILIVACIGFFAGIWIFKGFGSFTARHAGRAKSAYHSGEARELLKETRLLEKEMREQAQMRSKMRDSIGNIAKKNPEKIAGALKKWLANGNGSAL